MDILKNLETDFIAQQAVMDLICKIDNFKDKWDKGGNEHNKYLKVSHRIISSGRSDSSSRIKKSQRIDKEASELIKIIKITKFKNRCYDEVSGYNDALKVIFNRYGEIPIGESQFKDLHRLLLKYSEKDQQHRGEYKRHSNRVVAIYPDDRERVIFQTTEPHLTEQEMRILINWVQEQLENDLLYPLLTTSIFIYEFLSIHPFQDGNGRMARLLTNLLLLRTGYKFIQCISFEDLIDERKNEYYEALMQGQKDRGSNKENITQWVSFFLESIEMLTLQFGEILSDGKINGSGLYNRKTKFKNFAREKQLIESVDIKTAFTTVSINTKNDESSGVRIGTKYATKK